MSGIIRKFALIVGLVWLLFAFAAYYYMRPLHLIIIERNWNQIGLPWVEEMRHGWQGVPWEVVIQGGLLLWIAVVVGVLGWGVGRRFLGGRSLGPARLLARGDRKKSQDDRQCAENHRLAACATVVWGSGLVLGGLGMLVFFVGIIGVLHHARVIFGGMLVLGTFGALWVVKSARREIGRRAALEGRKDAAQESPLHPVSPTEPCPLPQERGNKGTHLTGVVGWNADSFSYAEKACLGIIVFLESAFLLYALTPSMQSDALRYHLAAPQEWLKAGGLVYLPYNAFSNFPSVIEMLFMFGLGLGGDLLAKGFHFLFLPLTTVAIAVISEQLTVDGKFLTMSSDLEEARESRDPNRSSKWRIRPSVLAAVAWGTSPLVLPLAGWAFIDLGVLFFTLGMIYFLLRWERTRERRDWVVAAVFGGLLVGSKYTGILTVGFGSLLVVLFSLRMPVSFPGRKCGAAVGEPSPLAPTPLPQERGNRGSQPAESGGQSNRGSVGQSNTGLLEGLRRGIFLGLIAAAIALPWWIKNVVYTGNPVYPLAHSIFDGGEWTETNAAIYSAKLKEKGEGRDLAAFVRLPWSTAVYPLEFGSSEIGPLYWVFAPWIIVWAGLAFWRRRQNEGALMLTAWGVFFLGYWFFTYQDNRFLLPFLAMATAGIAAISHQLTVNSDQVTLNREQGSCEGGVLRIGVLAVFLVVIAYSTIDDVRWLVFRAGQGVARWPAYTLGFMSRDDYLAANLNYYRTAEYCSKVLPKDDKVLLVGEHRKFHWKCRVEGSDWYDVPRILPFLRKSRSTDELLDLLEKSGFTHIFFNLQEWGWPESAMAQTGDEKVPPSSAWYYNRQFLAREDVVKIQNLLRSERLRTVLAAMPGRIFLSEILNAPQPK